MQVSYQAFTGSEICLGTDPGVSPMAETPAQHRVWHRVGISNRLLVLMKILDASLDWPARTNLLTSQLGPREAGSELSPMCAEGVQAGVTVPQQLNALVGKADRRELEQDSGKTPKVH